MTVERPVSVNAILHEKLALMAAGAVGVLSVQDAPLLARKVTCPLVGAGVALTEAVNFTGWLSVEGSGVSLMMLITVLMSARCSTTRLLAGWPTASWLRKAS